MISIKQILGNAGVLALMVAGGLAWHYHDVAHWQAELAAARGQAPGSENPALGEGKNAAAPTLAQIMKEGGRDPVESTREMLRFVDNIKPGEIRGALEGLRKMPWNLTNFSLKGMLLSKWVDSDPEAAVLWVKTRDAKNNRYDDFAQLFQAWGAKDPVAALAGLKLVGEPDYQSYAEGWLLGTVAETDPQKALSLLKQLPAGQNSDNAMWYIFQHWAGADPTAAAAAAMQMAPGSARTTALSGLTYAWAMQDPQAVLAFADKLIVGGGKISAIDYALNALAQEDPAAAAHYLDTMTPGDSRNTIIAKVSAIWAQTDPGAALTWLQKSAGTGQAYDKAVAGVLAQMGEADPGGAAAFIAQMPDATTRKGAIAQLATTWAQNDFAGAMAWAKALPATEGDTRSAALKNVMLNLDNSDPVGAAAYLTQNFANDPNFNVLAEQLVGRWGPSDPQASLAWAEALPAGMARDNAMTTALTNLANTDPQAAWSAAMQMTNEDAKAQTMMGVIQNWSTLNPAQAAAVFDQMPDGEQQVTAAAALAKAWLGEDPTAASQWISTLPSGKARDAAVVRLVAAEGDNDPAGVFNWAASISAGAQKVKQMGIVAGMWARKDPTAALAAVQAAQVTDAQRTILLKAVQQAPSVTVPTK